MQILSLQELLISKRETTRNNNNRAESCGCALLQRLNKVFHHCARKILHEQERSTCLEAAAKGKSGKFSKPISHSHFRACWLSWTLIQKIHGTRNFVVCAVSQLETGPKKAVLVRAPKRAPDFGFLRRKYKLTQFGVPNWSSDWGAISGAQLCRFFSSRSHICLHSWSLCSKVNRTLRSSVLLHHAGVPLKLEV